MHQSPLSASRGQRTEKRASFRVFGNKPVIQAEEESTQQFATPRQDFSKKQSSRLDPDYIESFRNVGLSSTLAATNMQPSMRSQTSTSIFADHLSRKRHYRDLSIEQPLQSSKPIFEKQRRPPNFFTQLSGPQKTVFEPEEKFFTPRAEETPFQVRFFNQLTDKKPFLQPSQPQRLRPEDKQEKVLVEMEKTQVLDSNVLRNDVFCDNRNGVAGFTFQRFGLVDFQQTSLPSEILQRISKIEIQKERDGQSATIFNAGLLPEINCAYFSFDTELFIWPLGRVQGSRYDQTDIHQQVASETCLHYQHDEIIMRVFSLKKNFSMLDTSNFEFFLLVQDFGKVKIVHLHFDLDRGLVTQLEPSKLTFNAEKNPNFILKQCGRSGRIFFSAPDGCVRELQIKKDQKFMTRVFSFWQPSLSVSVKESYSSIPVSRKSLISFLTFSQTLEVIDISIDETRHLIYALVLNSKTNERFIDVYETGYLDDNFNKFAQIQGEKIIECFAELPLTSDEVQNYEILRVFAVPLSLSSNFHFFVVTRKGQRIYVNFREEEYSDAVLKLQMNPQNPSQHLVTRRILPEWQVKESKFLAKVDPQSALSSLIVNKQDPFDQEMNPEGDQTFELDPALIHFDTLTGALYYNSEQHPFLISLNQPPKKHAEAAEEIRATDAGAFSQLLAMGKPGAWIQTGRQSSILLGLFDQQQTATKISSTYIDRSITLLEQQVHLLPQRLDLLTNEKIIRLVEPRPIDLLFTIVVSSGEKLGKFQDFYFLECFVRRYGVRETCVMLVQLLCLQSYSPYAFLQELSDYVDLYFVKYYGTSQPSNQQNQGTQSKRQFIDGKSVERLTLDRNGGEFAIHTSAKRGQSQWNNSEQRHNRFNILDSAVSQVNHQKEPASMRRAPPSISQMISHEDLFRRRRCDKVVMRAMQTKDLIFARDCLKTFGDFVLVEEQEEQNHFRATLGYMNQQNSNNLPFLEKYEACKTFLARLLHPVMKMQIIVRQDTKDTARFIINTKCILKIRDSFLNLYQFLQKASQDLVNVTYPRVSEERKHSLQGIDRGEFAFSLPQIKQELISKAQKEDLEDVLKFLKKVQAAFDFVLMIDSIKEPAMFIRSLSIQQQESLCLLTFRELLVKESDKDLHRVIVSLADFTDNNSAYSIGVSTQKFAELHQKVTQTLLSKEDIARSLVEKLLDQAFQAHNYDIAREKVKKAVFILSENSNQALLTINLPKIIEEIFSFGFFTDGVYLIVSKKLQSKAILDETQSGLERTKQEQNIQECENLLCSVISTIESVCDPRVALQKEEERDNIQKVIVSQLSQLTKEQLFQVREKVLKKICEFNDRDSVRFLGHFLNSQGKSIQGILHQIDDATKQETLRMLSKQEARSKESFRNLLQDMKSKEQGLVYTQTLLDLLRGEIYLYDINPEDGQEIPAFLDLKEKQKFLNIAYGLLDNSKQVELQIRQSVHEQLTKTQKQMEVYKEVDEFLKIKLQVATRLDQKEVENEIEQERLQERLQKLNEEIGLIRQRLEELDTQELSQQEQIRIVEELKVQNYMIKLHLSNLEQNTVEPHLKITKEWDLLELIQGHAHLLFEAGKNSFSEQFNSCLKTWIQISQPSSISSKILPLCNIPIEEIIPIIEQLNWRIYNIEKEMKNLQNQRIYDNSAFWLVEFLVKNCRVDYKKLRELYNFIDRTAPENCSVSNGILTFIYLGVGWKIESENQISLDLYKRWQQSDFQNFVQSFQSEIEEKIEEHSEELQKQIKDFLLFLCYRKKEKLPNLDRQKRQAINGVQIFGPIEQPRGRQMEQKEELKEQRTGFSLGRPSQQMEVEVSPDIFTEQRSKSTFTRTPNNFTGTRGPIISTAENSRNPFGNS